MATTLSNVNLFVRDIEQARQFYGDLPSGAKAQELQPWDEHITSAAFASYG